MLRDLGFQRAGLRERGSAQKRKDENSKSATETYAKHDGPFVRRAAI